MTIKTTANKEMIITYLTEHPSAKSGEIAEYIGLKPTRTKTLLYQMIADQIVVAEGSNKNRIYKLKY